MDSCGLCKFDIPSGAIVCAHCGAHSVDIKLTYGVQRRIINGFGVFLLTLFPVAAFFKEIFGIRSIFAVVMTFILSLLFGYLAFKIKTHKQKAWRR